MGHELAQRPDLLLGHRHLGDEVSAKELRENVGIDFVGLDPCVSDRLDLHRVGDHDPCAVSPEQRPNGPRVEGGLEDGRILLGQ